MSDQPDSELTREMGIRLRRVRQALGLTQVQIVRGYGITPSGWSAWEGGRNQIKVTALAKLANRYGFTTDYVSKGDLSGVRKDLADRLQLLDDEPAPSKPTRGRPRGDSLR